MKWSEVVPKKPGGFTGKITRMAIMDGSGKVLAELTDDVYGIDLGETVLPVSSSGVAATVRFQTEDGGDLVMPTKVGPLLAGTTLEVGT